MRKTITITFVGLATLAIITYVYLTIFSISPPPGHLVSHLPKKYGDAALRKRDSYLIQNVSVIPMNRDTVLLHHNVLIEQGRIKQISSPLTGIDTSSNPVLINGKGKFLIRG